MNSRHASLQATIVKPEQAVSITPFGLDAKVLLTTEATGGTLSVLMAWHKPGEGPPDHVHFSQEEVFFILEGTYELTVDGKTTTAGPGTIVFIPRNVVHRFKNVGDTAARMLDWSLPGGQATTSERSPSSPPAAASPARRCWSSARNSIRTSLPRSAARGIEVMSTTSVDGFRTTHLERS